MKLYYYAMLMLLWSISSTNLSGQAATAVTETQLFSPTEELQSYEKQQILTANHLAKADLLSLGATRLASLHTANKNHIRLQLPDQHGASVILDLEQVQVTSPDFKVYNSYNQLVPYQQGQHYRGTVVGHAQSMAAVSIFEGEVMGVFAFHGYNYNLEKLHSLTKRTESDQYILYAHEDVEELPHFDCHTSEKPADLRLPNPRGSQSTARQKSGSIVPIRVYMECDNRMYKDFSSNVQSTVDFTTGLFNVVAGLFSGADVMMEISEIKVWTTSDPYEAAIGGATSANSLGIFRCEAAVYNGRLAHLLSTGSQRLGGIAQLPSNEFCPNGSSNHGFSNIDRGYNDNLSTYSWSVNVLAHELGHQMSSPHTHACAWNGNNTQINDCGNVWLVTNGDDDDGDGETDEADEAEGGECWDRNNPIIPNKGTIMSYCHLRTGNGIDLSRGFHPQIRERIGDFANSCIDEVVSCFTPARSEIIVDNLTESSARINFTRTEGIVYFYFSYRKLGDEEWINSGVQEVNYFDVASLVPNTTYEIRMFIFCSDWSGQSCFVTFTTQGETACTGFDLEMGDITDPKCDANDGRALIKVTRGTPPFNLSWEGPTTGSTTANVRTLIAADLTEGVYIATVVDKNDCSTTIEFNMTDDEDCAALRCIRKSEITCGQTISTTLEGQPNDYDADDLRSCLPNADGLDGPDKAYEFTLTEPMSVSIRLSGTTNDMDMYLLNTCIEGGICLEASLGIGAVDEVINTSLGAGTYFILVDRFEALEGGNDEYDLNLTCGDCNPDYSVTTIEQVDPGCEESNGSIQLVITEGIPNFTASWEGPVSGSITGSNRIITLENLPAGDYNVTIEDSNDCMIQTNFTLISGCACNNYDINLSDIQPVDCEGNGGQFVVNITEGTAPFMMQVQGTLFAELDLENRSTNITGLPAGQYLIKVTDANGCEDEETLIIETDASCGCTGFFVELRNETTPGCGASDAQFDIVIEGGTPDFTITWAGATAGSTMVDGRFFTLRDLPAGDYNIEVSDATGCVKDAFITLTESLDCACENFALSINNITQPTCEIESGAFRLNIIGGSPLYSISLSGSEESNFNFNEEEYTFQNLDAGTYNIAVTDVNGCTANTSITLTEDTAACACEGFSINLSNTVNPNCDAMDGKFDIGITGGTAEFTVQWSGASSGSETINERFYSLKNLGEGTYDILVTEAGGCSTSTSMTLSEPDDCVEEDICEGFAIDLRNPVNPNCNSSDGKFDVVISNGTADFTIAWDGPVSGSQVQPGRWFSVKNLPQGDYTVIVTDGNDCSQTADITISEPDDCVEEDICEGFAIDLRNPVNPNCNSSDGKFDIVISNGTADFTIAWTGPMSGTQVQGGRWFSVKNLPQGDYTVIVTDGNDCNQTANITISEPDDCVEEDICEGFAIDLRNPVNPNCNSSDGKFDIVISNGTADFTIAWDGPVSGTQVQGGRWFSVKNLPQGDYAVIVTDNNNCNINASINLSEPDDCIEEDPCEGFAVDLRNPVDASCDENDGKFDVVVENGTADFTITWDGAAMGTQMQSGRFYSVKDLGAGDYTVNVMDANDCSDSAMITLNEGECDPCLAFAVSTSDITQPTCENPEGQFMLNITGGTAPYEVTNNGEMSMYQTASITISGMYGTYDMGIVDANGCSATVMLTLEEAQNCIQDCSTIATIDCNQTINSTTIDSENNFVAADYDCYNQAANFEGGDVVYSIEIESNVTRLTLDLTNMSKDLDLFLLDDCMPGANCIAESGHSSAFLDERIRIDNPAAGIYYIVVDGTSANENSDFRLKASCRRGFGLVTGEDGNSSINTLEIFPNPTNGNLLAKASLPEATSARLELINAMGQVVSVYEATNAEYIQHQFDLSAQAAGIYFLKLQTATATKVEQVVLMK